MLEIWGIRQWCKKRFEPGRHGLAEGGPPVTVGAPLANNSEKG